MNIYLKILNSYRQSQISDLNLLCKTQVIDTLCGGIGHCFFFSFHSLPSVKSVIVLELVSFEQDFK